MKTINMVGMKFGKLTVTAMLPNSRCMCDCECGKTGHATESYSVRKGLSKSCGCSVQDGNHTIHGESRQGHWTPEYRAWVNMRTRCYNPKATRYEDWGGRGIEVCERWRESYAAFLEDVGRRPTKRHQLDRINNSLNYVPGNVQWSTPRAQARNQRSNRMVCAFGQAKISVEWAEEFGIRGSILRDRLDHGWTPERALTTPPKVNQQRGKYAA